MKAKIIFLLCLFAGIAMTQVSAQDKAKNAGQGWSTSTYWSPVFCDDKLVDVLEGGEIRVHKVVRWVPGISYKEIVQIKGEVTSESGEVFKISERDWYHNMDGTWYVSWHFNLKGNRGSHYIGTITQNLATGELTVGKTVCH